MQPEPFPAWFFDRDDPTDDGAFYRSPRLVTHIDDGAIAAVGDRYVELGIDGAAPRPTRVLDLMSSWISHFRTPPADLVVLGMNERELTANRAAAARVVQDLNRDPVLPFPDASFDAVVCCVSIDYLIRPVKVIRECARVLVPDGPLVVTFSNRCFPTKAVHGWLALGDTGRLALVAEYILRAGGFDEPVRQRRTPPGPDEGGRYRGDPLLAVVARRTGPA